MAGFDGDTDDDRLYARRENAAMEADTDPVDTDALLTAYQSGDPAQVAQRGAVHRGCAG